MIGTVCTASHRLLDEDRRRHAESRGGKQSRRGNTNSGGNYSCHAELGDWETADSRWGDSERYQLKLSVILLCLSVTFTPIATYMCYRAAVSHCLCCETGAHLARPVSISTGLSNEVAGFPGRDDSSETQRLGEEFDHILLSPIFLYTAYLCCTVMNILL